MDGGGLQRGAQSGADCRGVGAKNRDGLQRGERGVTAMNMRVICGRGQSCHGWRQIAERSAEMAAILGTDGG
jgi:hypothetical protein